MRSTLALAIIALVCSCIPLRAAEELPVIVVQLDSSSRRLQKPQEKYPGLLVAIWRDGKIIWSGDQAKGGAPLLTARIEGEKVRQLLQRWSADIELDQKKFPRGYLGPDSSFHTITLQLEKERIELASWHELFEDNPKLVAMPGITPLDGQTREEALKKAPKAFLRFREVWKDIRTSVGALLPATGDAFDGEISLKTKPIKKTEK